MIFGPAVRENAFEMNRIMSCPLLKLNKKIESTNVEINFLSLAFSAKSGWNRDSQLSILSNWILFFLRAYFKVRRTFFLLSVTYFLMTLIHISPWRSNPLTTGQKLILWALVRFARRQSETESHTSKLCQIPAVLYVSSSSRKISNFMSNDAYWGGRGCNILRALYLPPVQREGTGAGLVSFSTYNMVM